MSLGMNVLFRFSQKTGKVDKTLTGISPALAKMWALNNTPKTKACLVIDTATGKILFATKGTADGYPEAKDAKKEDLGVCSDYGIPLDVVRMVTEE